MIREGPARPSENGERGWTSLARFLDAADDLLRTETSPEEAIGGALRLLCDHAGWPLGHVFRVGDDPDVLESTGIWNDEQPELHRGFVATTRGLRLRRGEGIPVRRRRAA